MASQDWVREKCSRNRNLLLDNDMLGDHSLSTNSQARYLLHLLNPYCSASETSAESAQLARMDSSTAMEHILKVYYGVFSSITVLNLIEHKIMKILKNVLFSGKSHQSPHVHVHI